MGYHKAILRGEQYWADLFCGFEKGLDMPLGMRASPHPTSSSVFDGAIWFLPELWESPQPTDSNLAIQMAAEKLADLSPGSGGLRGAGGVILRVGLAFKDK